MKRVLILGPSGAGKSTFARALAEKTGLPLIHLDKEYWNAGWVETPDEIWFPKVEALAARDSWIMDGGYSATLPLRLPRTDTVFLFRRPRWLYFLRAVWRTFRYYGTTRPDLADGCPERFDMEFLKWVWNYERDAMPRLLDMLKEHGQHVKLVHILSDDESRSYLESVGKNA